MSNLKKGCFAYTVNSRCFRALDGGSHVAYQILKRPMPHVSVTKKWLSSLSIIRNACVVCHYDFKPCCLVA